MLRRNGFHSFAKAKQEGHVIVGDEEKFRKAVDEHLLKHQFELLRLTNEVRKLA